MSAERILMSDAKEIGTRAPRKRTKGEAVQANIAKKWDSRAMAELERIMFGEASVVDRLTDVEFGGIEILSTSTGFIFSVCHMIDTEGRTIISITNVSDPEDHQDRLVSNDWIGIMSVKSMDVFSFITTRPTPVVPSEPATDTVLASKRPLTTAPPPTQLCLF
jgi:hypothetical protein